MIPVPSCFVCEDLLFSLRAQYIMIHNIIIREPPTATPIEMEKRCVSLSGGKRLSWNSWLAVPWVLLPTHCRVDVCVSDWCRVMELLKPVLFNLSSLMNVFEELLTGRPDRCHSSSGEGFPSTSQKHTVTSVPLQLEEGEILGAYWTCNVMLSCAVLFLSCSW